MEEPKKYPVIDYGFDEQGLMGVGIMSLVSMVKKMRGR